MLISILIVLVVTLSPGNGEIAGNYLDKLLHFVVFFFLAINILFKYYSDKRLIEILLWTVVSGLLTEVIQQFIPGRNMDIYDGIADVFGIIAAYYLYSKKEKYISNLLLKIGF